LNKELEKTGRVDPLGVLVQVLSSDEDTKSGVDPKDALSLISFINT
jgi:hypothetical protein